MPTTKFSTVTVIREGCVYRDVKVADTSTGGKKITVNGTTVLIAEGKKVTLP
jgi:hypothetical protein